MTLQWILLLSFIRRIAEHDIDRWLIMKDQFGVSDQRRIRLNSRWNREFMTHRCSDGSPTVTAQNYLLFSADHIHASRIFRFNWKEGASRHDTKNGVDDRGGSDPRLKTWHSGIYLPNVHTEIAGSLEHIEPHILKRAGMWAERSHINVEDQWTRALDQKLRTAFGL